MVNEYKQGIPVYLQLPPWNCLLTLNDVFQGGIMLRAKYHNIIALLVLGLLLGTDSVRADTEKPVITGAGAHFSWVVFDALKPELEKKLGRDLKLFGRESMLGAGCNAGIKSAQQHTRGHETFGFVCCPLSPKEVSENRLKIYPLALEPILILVNRENSIENLSIEQARGIFSGKIVNWNEVGGDDAPIVVVTRLHCAKRPGHWKTILKSKKKFSSKRLNVQSAADMVSRLNDFNTAIGHTGSVWQFKKDDHVKSLTINGYAPTAANIKTGKYPFYRMGSAIVSETASGDVIKLMKMTQSLLQNHEIAKRFSILPYSDEHAALFAKSGEIQ